MPRPELAAPPDTAASFGNHDFPALAGGCAGPDRAVSAGEVEGLWPWLWLVL